MAEKPWFHRPIQHNHEPTWGLSQIVTWIIQITRFVSKLVAMLKMFWLKVIEAKVLSASSSSRNVFYSQNTNYSTLMIQLWWADSSAPRFKVESLVLFRPPLLIKLLLIKGLAQGSFPDREDSDERDAGLVDIARWDDWACGQKPLFNFILCLRSYA